MNKKPDNGAQEEVNNRNGQQFFKTVNNRKVNIIYIPDTVYQQILVGGDNDVQIFVLKFSSSSILTRNYLLLICRLCLSCCIHGLLPLAIYQVYVQTWFMWTVSDMDVLKEFSTTTTAYTSIATHMKNLRKSRETWNPWKPRIVTSRRDSKFPLSTLSLDILVSYWYFLQVTFTLPGRVN